MKSIQQMIIDDRKALLTASLLASMEILKEDFGFTQEQLQKFSDKYIPAVQKNLGPQNK